MLTVLDRALEAAPETHSLLLLKARVLRLTNRAIRAGFWCLLCRRHGSKSAEASLKNIDELPIFVLPLPTAECRLPRRESRMVKRNSNKLQARGRTGWHSRRYLQQPLGFAFAHLALVNTFKLGAQASCSSGDRNCSATPPRPFLVPESSSVKPNLAWR